MLTESYILQSNRSKFSKYAVLSTCLLCHTAHEDLKHFLLDCFKMQPVRTGMKPGMGGGGGGEGEGDLLSKRVG